MDKSIIDSLITDRASTLRYSYIALFVIALSFSKAFTDILASLLAAYFLYYSYKNKDWKWLKDKWFIFAILFWGFIVIRTGFIDNIELRNFGSAVVWIRFVVFTVAFYKLILIETKFINFFLGALVVLLLFLSADVFWQYISGQDFFGRSPHSPERMTGPYRMPRVGSMLMYFIFPCIAYIIIYSSKKSEKYSGAKKAILFVLPICFIILVMMAIYFSGDRTPFLLSVAAFFILIFLVKKKYAFWIIISIILIGSFIKLTSINGHTAFKRQISKTYEILLDYKDSSYGRIAQDAINLSMNSPFFGHGVNQYEKKCIEAKFSLKSECYIHPHNIFLEVFFEGGAVGLLLFLCMCYFVVLKTFTPPVVLPGYELLLKCILLTLLLRLFPVAPVTSFFGSVSAITFYAVFATGLSLLDKKQPTKI